MISKTYLAEAQKIKFTTKVIFRRRNSSLFISEGCGSYKISFTKRFVLLSLFWEKYSLVPTGISQYVLTCQKKLRI